MKILFLAPYFPYPPVGGGKLRIYHLLRELTKRHDVSLLTFANQEDIAHQQAVQELGINEICLVPFPARIHESGWRQLFRLQPQLIRSYFSPIFLDSLKQFLNSKQFDIVHIEEIVMAAYILETQPSLPVVVEHQKIDYDFYWKILKTFNRNAKIPSKVLNLLEWLKLYFYEYQLARHIKYHVILAEDDRNLITRLNPETSISLVPNGVDIDYFQYTPLLTADPKSIAFVGSMNYQPNIDAVLFFMSDIFPLVRAKIEDLKIYLVGRDPVPQIARLNNHNNVIVTGTVPDIRPYLQRCLFSFAPVRIGGGIRNKILESMAVGRPVVSTHIGAEGICYEHGKNILVADSPGEFAKHIVELGENSALREHLATNGRRLVEEKYTWSLMAEHLTHVYEQKVLSFA